ncbi:MAG TPA: LytTR family DNA-binding domain-containing protein [Cellulomonas sp.]
MIRVAVVEDDPDDARRLTDFVQRYSDESHQPLQVTTYSDGEDLVTGYRAGFDIVLMDVEMAGMDGLTAAAHIRRIDQAVVIVFITNMAQYAIHGYTVDALDYVLKPIAYFAFSQRLRRAVARVRRREDRFLVINARGTVNRVPVSSVLWIESRRHRLIYHTTDGRHESTTRSMKQVEEELRTEHFFRCNKCYLVNLGVTKGLEHGYAVLTDGTRVAVSQSKQRDFLRALTGYAGEAVR